MLTARTWYPRRGSLHSDPETQRQPGNPSSQTPLQPDSIGSFLAFLRDRRALYASAKMLTKDDARISVKKILLECLACMAELPGNAPTKRAFLEISDACGQFMESTDDTPVNLEFFTALCAFRTTVSEQIEYLLAVYMVELTEPLTAINLPDDR